MGNTTHLDIVEVAENQTDRYLTINAAIGALEAASHGIEIDTSTGTTAIDYSNATGTPATYLGSFFFDLTGTKSGAFDMTLPDVTPTGAVAINRFFMVRNGTGQTVTIQSETAGTSVTLATGESGIFYQKANVILRLNIPEEPPAPDPMPYDAAFYVADTPITNQIIGEVMFARSCTIPDDFSGSVGYTGTNPTATFEIDIQRNGTSVGHVSFSTGGIATFVTDATTVTMSAGDRLTLVAPTTVDAAVAEIAITIAATVD
jgi:hypothetical protein